jgi:hypothetical protein
VEYFEIFSEDVRGFLFVYFVMEHCKGGDLSGVLDECKKTKKFLEYPVFSFHLIFILFSFC